MAWLVDLDGVVWRGREALPGGAEAVARLRAAGQRVVFVTNNSAPTVDEHLEHLGECGIDAGPADVLTSAQAAASVLPRGATAMVIGDDGIREALEARGVREVSSRADAVVVGRDDDFTYGRLADAADAIRRGARFIATNDDATFPVYGALLPGAGAMVAAVAVASETRPTIAGKPHPTMVGLVRMLVRDIDIMVGDRPDTDGRFARALGAPFGLVLTGVTERGEGVDADQVAPSLAELVDRRLGGG